MKYFHQEKNTERGNVLFLILAAIALFAALSVAITRSSQQSAPDFSKEIRDSQIQGMLDYASALQVALQQMVANGEAPEDLYTDLSLLKPGDATFEDSPTMLKIYHPLGGGITPLDASASDSNAIATDYDINAGSIITGVGATDATIGDIVFTAHISSESYCARINSLLLSSSTVPVLATATFNQLFGGTTTTVNAGNCASCVNKARLCVSNTANTAWGFYEALFPG